MPYMFNRQYMYGIMGEMHLVIQKKNTVGQTHIHTHTYVHQHIHTCTRTCTHTHMYPYTHNGYHDVEFFMSYRSLGIIRRERIFV